MKLLLHMCCGPCSCYPVKKLKSENVDITGYFFNPNIHGYKEWELRLKAAEDFAAQTEIEFYADREYRLRDFLTRALKVEGVSNERCNMCYAWRLDEAARFAAEKGFEAFSSTLFYSIYQQHDLMKKIAVNAAKKYNVKFLYEDFRVGWQEGIDMSIEMGLYRQPYCGCIFSEEERYTKAVSNRSKRRALKARLQQAQEEMQSGVKDEYELL